MISAVILGREVGEGYGKLDNLVVYNQNKVYLFIYLFLFILIIKTMYVTLLVLD